jgi:hypothetical protein
VKELIIQVGNKSVSLNQSNIKIYEQNNKTIIRGDNIMKSMHISYGLQSNNPAPIKIERVAKDRIQIYNNMSEIELRSENDKVCSGESAKITLKSDRRTFWLESIKVINLNKNEEVFELKILNKDASADISLNNYINEPYVNSEDRKPHYKDLSVAVKRSESARRMGSGQFRDVYKLETSDIPVKSAHKGSIIKIANSQRGVQANKSEVQTWQTVKSTRCKVLFCPITHIGPNHKYIIMNEAKDVGRLERNIIKELEKRVKNSLSLDENSYEIDHPLRQSGWDIKKSNVGVYNGHPVLVDYPYGGKFRIDDQQIKYELKDLLNKNR